MTTLWQKLGIILFWLCWPALWLYLRWSTRTRVIVVADGKILVLRGWLGDGKWTLPGGGLHKGEDSAVGAVRELGEETGISVAPSGITLLKETMFRGNGIRFRCKYYYAHLPAIPATKHQRFEIVDSAWLEPGAIDRANCGVDVLNAVRLLDSRSLL